MAAGNYNSYMSLCLWERAKKWGNWRYNKKQIHQKQAIDIYLRSEYHETGYKIIWERWAKVEWP